MDAAGCGHLGAALYVCGQKLVFSTHIPDWVTRTQCDICDVEITAPLYELRIEAELFPSRNVILRCDNRGETQTLVRGAIRPSLSCADLELGRGPNASSADRISYRQT